MHCVHHQFECRVDDCPRLLGVEVLHQIHRTLDVGKQRGDHLALTVKQLAGRLFRRDTNIGSR
jgi:hypothetical protein